MLYPDNLAVFALTFVVAVGGIFKSFDVIDWLFQAQVRSVYSAISRTLGLLTGSFAQVALVVIGASLVSFAWASALELAVTALALVIALRLTSTYKIGAVFQWERAKRFLGQSWPLMIAGATVVIQSRIDHVILAQARGDAELGQYALAVRIIEAFIVGGSIVVGSVAPSVIKARSRSPQAYRAALTNLYRLVLIASGLSALILILLPKQVWLLMVGQEYTNAVELLPLLSVRLIISSLGVAKSIFTVNEGLFRFTMFGYCLGAACGTPLVYVLAPQYGAVGAAIASVVSFGVSTFLLDVLYRPARANIALIWRACLSPWRIGSL
jgi:O-antigen/teichoic acid export membrane protein